MPKPLRHSLDRKYQNVGIIGNGDMGAPLADMFRHFGCNVSITDPVESGKMQDTRYRRRVIMNNNEVMADADVVVLAAPLGVMCGGDISAITDRPETIARGKLATDVSSLKLDPIELERSLTGARIIGTHPMLRLSTEHPRDERGVIFCPTAGEHTDGDMRFLTDFWRYYGPQIHECTAEFHDSAMSVIQGMSHLSMLFPEFIRARHELAEEPERIHAKERGEWLKNILGNTPAVIAGIAELNPENLASIEFIRDEIAKRLKNDISDTLPIDAAEIEDANGSIDQISLLFPDIALRRRGLSWVDLNNFHTDISASRMEMAGIGAHDNVSEFLDDRFDSMGNDGAAGLRIIHAYLGEIRKLLENRNYMSLLTSVKEYRNSVDESERMAA